MNKRYRLVLFGLEIIALIIVTHLCTGNILLALSDLWFSSGLLMLILLSLIDQPFFSKDTNIFVNGVTGFLALLLIEQSKRDWIFWTFFGFVIYLLVSSYILMWVRRNELNEEKKSVQFFSRINRIIGSPHVLFSAFFLWGAFLQFGITNKKYIPIFWYWLIVILLDTSSLAKTIAELLTKKKQEAESTAIGNILGVQGRDILLIKLFPFEQRKTVSLFEPVIFKLKSNKKTGKGIVIESYLLNEQQWIKVLKIDNGLEEVISDPNKKLLEDVVYKIDIPKGKEISFLKTFIGIVYENSDIDKLTFIYDSKIPVESGMLIEVQQRNKKVIYQIFNGLTQQEALEAKNKSDMIIGTALQLGVWDEKNNRFEKYGWVPSINTPVHIASRPKLAKLEEGIIELGKVPNTDFPVLMDINTAITHHMAVLGITGTGKSVFVRELIRKYITNSNRKIIIFDFTGEHKTKFSEAKILFDANTLNTIYNHFKTINAQMDSGYKKDPNIIENETKAVKLEILRILNDFVQSEDTISIIETPTVDNNTNMLDFISYCFKAIFSIAKKDLITKQLPQLCIVVEEAHTIIPEWNFVADAKGNNHAINAISQVALQGRKYNVGLLVIAQRTATVSKNILTQCNSIISFTEYDNTSIDFLANYYGDSIANILPSLKFRQAVAAGKAFSSTVPMIFEVPEIKEKTI